MTFEARIRSTATRLIAARGARVVYSMPTREVGMTPWLPEDSPSNDAAVSMLIGNEGSSISSFRQQFNVAEAQLEGSLQGFIAPGVLSRDPNFRDAVTLPNGEIWYVAAFDIIRPSGIPLLYVLELVQ